MNHVSEIKLLCQELFDTYNARGFMDKFGNPKKFAKWEQYYGKEATFYIDEFTSSHLIASNKNESYSSCLKYMLSRLIQYVNEGIDVQKAKTIYMSNVISVGRGTYE